MKRFKNILVVFDSRIDNRALLDQVIGLAQRNQAALMVVDVLEGTYRAMDRPSYGQEVVPNQSDIPIIEEFPFDTPIELDADAPVKGVNSSISTANLPKIDIQEFIQKQEESSLQKFVAAIQQAGIQATSKTLFGIPFIEIIKEVLRNHHDLVMVTADGGGVKESIFGNTTMHLMRKCPCPVWVIKPGQPKHFNRILAAVNLDPDEKSLPTLAIKIMELATSLARLGQSELLVLHTWRLPGKSIAKARGGFPIEELKILLQETREAHRQKLIEFLRQFTKEDLNPEVYLLKGEAGVLIPELALAKAVDLIVMGTVSRAGVAGLFIGNTAEKVLHQVNCSVLTVKPEGFITPVKLD